MANGAVGCPCIVTPRFVNKADCGHEGSAGAVAQFGSNNTDLAGFARQILTELVGKRHAACAIII
jgi:hypothetical protein